MTTSKNIMKNVKVAIAETSIIDGRLCAGRKISVVGMAQAAGVSRKQAARCLRALARAGWLRLLHVQSVPARELGEKYGPPRRNPVYEVVGDIRQRRDNQVKSRATCRDKIWSTLRICRMATVTELCRLTACAPDTVREYLQLLEREDVIRHVSTRGHAKVWALCRHNGPARPDTPDRKTVRKTEQKNGQKEVAS